MIRKESKREPNFIDEEINLLADMCLENKSVLEGDFNNPQANRRRNKLWEEIVHQMNSLNKGVAIRNIEGVRHKWSCLKTEAKKKYSRLKIARQATGGGALSEKDLLEWEWKIVHFMGADSLEGVSSGSEVGVGEKRPSTELSSSVTESLRTSSAIGSDVHSGDSQFHCSFSDFSIEPSEGFQEYSQSPNFQVPRKRAGSMQDRPGFSSTSSIKQASFCSQSSENPPPKSYKSSSSSSRTCSMQEINAPTFLKRDYVEEVLKVESEKKGMLQSINNNLIDISNHLGVLNARLSSLIKVLSLATNAYISANTAYITDEGVCPIELYSAETPSPASFCKPMAID